MPINSSGTKSRRSSGEARQNQQRQQPRSPRQSRSSRPSSRRQTIDDRDERDEHSPTQYRHHRRSATVPATAAQSWPTVRRSPSTIHPTRTALGEIGKSIWDSFFDRRAGGKKSRPGSSRHGSKSPEQHEKQAVGKQDAVHGKLDHIRDYLHVGEETRHKIENFVYGTEDHKIYHTARDIIDELMDEHDVSARQMVLRLIPELRHLLADDERSHKQQKRREGYKEEARALFRELKLCFVKLDGRDCRALVEYIVAKERNTDNSDIDESVVENSRRSYGGAHRRSSDAGLDGSVRLSGQKREAALSKPMVYGGSISDVPVQIGSPKLRPQITH